MKATKQSHDWHCNNHDTYGWRGEECKQCPAAPYDATSELQVEIATLKEKVTQLEFRNERLVADYTSVQEEISTIRRIHVQNIAIKDAEIARWKTVPMKYRRMEFNAQLQAENAELKAENKAIRLAAAEVARISDRKHDAWDKLKALLAKYPKCGSDDYIQIDSEGDGVAPESTYFLCNDCGHVSDPE